jgi:hypothetical protein
MYYRLFLSLGSLVVGIIALLLSRRMNTIVEDEEKSGHWFHELLYGPPGYRRASTAMMGIILIILGAVVAFTLLF